MVFRISRALGPVLLPLLGSSLLACSSAVPAPEAAPVESETPEVVESAPPQRTVVDNSTAGVAQRHFKQLKEGNLEGLLGDYDDNAVVFTPGGMVKGKEALGEHFKALVEEFSAEGSSLSLGDLRVRDEMAYITWSANTGSRKYEMGTNTFVVMNGKIIAQSFAGNTDSEAEAGSDGAESASEGQTAEVIEHHLSAVETGDFEEVWTDYTRDSLILTQKGKKSGKEGVKGVVEALNSEFKNPKLKFELAQKLIDGEVAYVLWSVKTEGDARGFVTETFFIRDGKIASQSLTIGTPKG